MISKMTQNLINQNKIDFLNRLEEFQIVFLKRKDGDKKVILDKNRYAAACKSFLLEFGYSL